MAGHSKWANIKHKKAAQDSKRGKVFSRLSKKISSAARRGGGDEDTNHELRLWVQKAKAANMPNDNIERAILKATGQLEGVTYTDFTYEGYGPGGVAFMLEGSTDNKNRTVANIRHFFSKMGGNLGENGCVAWMFHDTGVITLEQDQVENTDSLMEVALENGAEDFEVEDGVITITSGPEEFMPLRDALNAAGYTEFISDEITKVAETDLSPDLATARSNMKLIDLLEEDDDVENVYHNLELSDEVAEALGAES
ncbi:YebC/PmpR family DNA-binding transcriptional regulator [Lujinxingia litoralis]|uniref:Probable transcriptional regulatory protein DL240_02445 n=1 Tax=Lujinxingia litoralis TaxID=2211119 RepID=A0A328CE33_9DELT|nr:YebC/PmpR family DNA-binding transcriptional regulator [Lujinxingia litoralis]RAL25093.1 YebC/PmpR family DNA-binding transcriptional regulator [Lujinxingia litoralis]